MWQKPENDVWENDDFKIWQFLKSFEVLHIATHFRPDNLNLIFRLMIIKFARILAHWCVCTANFALQILVASKGILVPVFRGI